MSLRRAKHSDGGSKSTKKITARRRIDRSKEIDIEDIKERSYK